MAGDSTQDVARDRLVGLGWSGPDSAGWTVPEAAAPAATSSTQAPAGRPATVLRLVRGKASGDADGPWPLPEPLAEECALALEGLDAAPDGSGPDASREAGAAVPSGLGALRERAVAAAVRGYTATHGHPLDHATAATRTGARWGVSTRVAVAAVVALAIPVSVVVARSWWTHPVTVLAATEADTPPGAGPGAPGWGGPGEVTRESVGEPSSEATDGRGAGLPPGSGSPATTDGAPGAFPGAGAGVAEVVVHVVGQVARPGLVVLAVGSRVGDAVAAAGGATGEADLAAINLARALVDGEQILVPRPGETPPAPASSPVGTSSGPVVPGPGEVLDLNAAEVADLDQIPGIGPVLAQRIVDWRTEHGRFSTVDELAEVRGIGPSLLADLRPRVRV